MESHDSQKEAVEAARVRFEEIVRAGALRVCERAVHYAVDREDRIQEGLAFAWQWFARQATLGRIPDTALVVHVCRLRTRDRGRRFVPGDGTRWGEDVFVQQERGLELRRLDGVHDHDEDGEHHEDDPSLGLAIPGRCNPNDNLISALDLATWLDSLPTVDRAMVIMRGDGHRLEEIAKATGRSVAMVFRRTRRLGYQLADRAAVDVSRLGRCAGTRRSETPRTNDLERAA